MPFFHPPRHKPPAAPTLLRRPLVLLALGLVSGLLWALFVLAAWWLLGAVGLR